eukprot:Clim_evm77s215 gene=Clim_evmTU77s215
MTWGLQKYSIAGRVNHAEMTALSNAFVRCAVQIHGDLVVKSKADLSEQTSAAFPDARVNLLVRHAATLLTADRWALQFSGNPSNTREVSSNLGLGMRYIDEPDNALEIVAQGLSTMGAQDASPSGRLAAAAGNLVSELSASIDELERCEELIEAYKTTAVECLEDLAKAEHIIETGHASLVLASHAFLLQASRTDGVQATIDVQEKLTAALMANIKDTEIFGNAWEFARRHAIQNIALRGRLTEPVSRDLLHAFQARREVASMDELLAWARLGTQMSLRQYDKISSDSYTVNESLDELAALDWHALLKRASEHTNVKPWHVLEWARTICRLEPSKRTIANVQELLKIARRTQPKNVEAEVFASLMLATRKYHDFHYRREADRGSLDALIDIMKDMQKRSIPFSDKHAITMISACRVQRPVYQSGAIVPDANNLDRRIWWLLREFDTLGLTMTTRMMDAVLEVLGESLAFSDMHHMFQGMLGQNIRRSHRIYHLLLRPTDFTEIVARHAVQSEIEAVDEYLRWCVNELPKQMEADGFDPRTFSLSLVKAAIRLGDPEQIATVAETYGNANERDRLHVLAHLLWYYTDSDMYQPAQQTFQLLQQERGANKYFKVVRAVTYFLGREVGSAQAVDYVSQRIAAAQESRQPLRLAPQMAYHALMEWLGAWERRRAQMGNAAGVGDIDFTTLPSISTPPERLPRGRSTPGLSQQLPNHSQGYVDSDDSDAEYPNPPDPQPSLFHSSQGPIQEHSAAERRGPPTETKGLSQEEVSRVREFLGLVAGHYQEKFDTLSRNRWLIDGIDSGPSSVGPVTEQARHLQKMVDRLHEAIAALDELAFEESGNVNPVQRARLHEQLFNILVADPRRFLGRGPTRAMVDGRQVSLGVMPEELMEDYDTAQVREVETSKGIFHSYG